MAKSAKPTRRGRQQKQPATIDLTANPADEAEAVSAGDGVTDASDPADFVDDAIHVEVAPQCDIDGQRSS